jgi:Ca-activated chloride channel family protein
MGNISSGRYVIHIEDLTIFEDDTMKITLSTLIFGTIISIYPISLFAQDEPVRIETNLVTLNVAITDKKGNYVRELSKNSFVITDNGIKQNIDTFSSETAPASIGIVYDMHPTTDDKTSSVLSALNQFAEKLTNSDDYFINVFGNNGSLTTEFVPTEKQVRDFVENGDRKGPTSLYDAIFAASNKVAGMKNPKKLLIVLTDGADHNSQHNLKELRLHLRSINLPVYSVTFSGDSRKMFGYADLYRSGPRQTFDLEETSNMDRAVLAELSKNTGGQSFEGSVRNRYYLAALCTKVLTEINNQYVIGFYPENSDGKWHHLRVSIISPDAGKYKTSSRRGYQSLSSRKVSKTKD